MASSGVSISYLDLSGNLVVWGSDSDSVVLHGTHFHGVPEMVSMVISGLCLVAFIAIIIWIPCAYLFRKRSRRLLTWSIIGSSAFFMTIYFALDVANRVLHELESKVTVYYLAIDIPMEKLVNLSEILLLIALLVYLLPTLQQNTPVARGITFAVADIGIVVLVVLLNLVGGVMYIYDFVSHKLGPPDPTNNTSISGEGGDTYTNTLTKFLGSVPWLNLTLYAVYLLGSISFAVQSLWARRELERTESLSKTLRIHILLLATSFSTRSLVSLVFFLVFDLHGRWATFNEQLIHMAFYGPLSVVIYASFVKVSATDVCDGGGAAKVVTLYAPVEQVVVGKDWVGWQQQQQQYHNKPKRASYVSVNETTRVPAYSPIY